MSSAVPYVAGGAVLLIAMLVLLFKAMWRVAEPNEALIDLRARHRIEGVDEGMGFRIVTGRGTFVLPGVQVVRSCRWISTSPDPWSSV